MREFIISTDSTADLPKTYLKENGIVVYPLYYMVDGIEYGIGIGELSSKEFYQSMRDGKLPTTSATSPKYITTVMKEQVAKGYDILHISFASTLSSSYNNAAVCAKEVMEEFPDANIIVIDSLSATSGQGVMVDKAIELKKQGKTIDEIANWIEENKLHFVHRFLLNDLSQVVRGGRLSGQADDVTGTLSIKPLLHVDDGGKVCAIGKIRGHKKALNQLVDEIQENIEGYGLDRVFITHADCLENAIYVSGRIKDKYNIENIVIGDMSPTTGAHTGPDTITIGYFGNKR